MEVGHKVEKQVGPVPVNTVFQSLLSWKLVIKWPGGTSGAGMRIVFQSLLSWKLVIKVSAISIHLGYFFFSILVVMEVGHKVRGQIVFKRRPILFQSLLSWKLVIKQGFSFPLAHTHHVSILVVMEVGHKEAEGIIIIRY